MKKSLFLALAVIFAVLLLDQSVKFWVKTHMFVGEQIHLFGSERLNIHFTENPGMAFGLEFGGNYGKLFLSLFRIFAVFGLGWYIWYLLKKGTSKLMLWCIALIFAGALGNIIDSCFYGLMFSDSNPMMQNVAQFMPAKGGYAGFLHGKVVDMFYFPLLRGHFPKWFPFWGGEDFEFFRPVFNIADASISVGVMMLIIFQKRLFGKRKEDAVEEIIQRAEEEKNNPAPDVNPDTISPTA